MSLLMSAPSHSLYADPAPSQRLPTVILGLCADQSSPSLLLGHGWGVLLPCVCQKGGMQGLGPLGEDGECLARTGPCLLKVTKTWPFSCFRPESPQKGSWQRDSHLPGAGAPNPPGRTWVSGLGSLSGHHADVPRPRSSPTGPCRSRREGSEGHRQLFLWQDSGAIYQGDKQ